MTISQRAYEALIKIYTKKIEETRTLLAQYEARLKELRKEDEVDGDRLENSQESQLEK